MELAIILAISVLLLASLLMSSVVRSLPLKEWKRRARVHKDHDSGKIYKAAAYGSSLDLLLWKIGSVSAAVLLIKAADASPWLVVVLALILSWLFWRSIRINLAKWHVKTAATIAPLFSWLLNYLQPVLGRLADWLEKNRLLPVHTQVYEKEDLLELIRSQGYQHDNRISEAELKMAAGALTFGDKPVGKVMTPRRVVKMVAATDTIGPLLMDELHASGFSRFPVVKELSNSASPEVVGMLYLHDLVGHAEKGRVRDLMKKKVSFINEEQSLRDALSAFLKTETHLLVVVNNFEEITGVITIEDVIEQILGEKIVDEFERYEDMRAVARAEANTEHTL